MLAASVAELILERVARIFFPFLFSCEEKKAEQYFKYDHTFPFEPSSQPQHGQPVVCNTINCPVLPSP